MLPAQNEVDQGFSDQQQAYQEGHRQRYLNERYERLMQQENAAAPTAVAGNPAAQEPEEQTDGFMADNEMTDYIQEEDEEEDPYYFVQAQERPHGDVYQAARVGDVQRVRYTLCRCAMRLCNTPATGQNGMTASCWC